MSYDALTDLSGAIHIFPDDHRDAAPRRRAGGLAGRRRRRDIIVHQPPGYPPPMPYGQMYPAPMQPMPYPPAPYPVHQPVAQQPAQGLDMRTALDAMGNLLPAVGKLVSAFRRAPERPTLTGDPEKDIASLADFIGENFDHSRTGAQTSGVLATAGAVMEILASL